MDWHAGLANALGRRDHTYSKTIFCCCANRSRSRMRSKQDIGEIFLFLNMKSWGDTNTVARETPRLHSSATAEESHCGFAPLRLGRVSEKIGHVSGLACATGDAHESRVLFSKTCWNSPDPSVVFVHNLRHLIKMLESLLPWAICRYVLEDFCCINLGGFSRGFSEWIFLGTFFPHKNEEKNPARKSAEKSGGPKIKIREESVLPKTDRP